MKHLLAILCGATFLAGPLAAQEDHSTHHHAGEPSSHSDDIRQGAADHIPPAPPTLTMGDMSQEQMNELMDMNDNAAIGMLLVDRAEWRADHGSGALHWDITGWYGNDFNKLEIQTEGEHGDSRTDSRNELLWNRIATRWWSVQAGIRHDTHAGPSRTWVAFGVKGLAPYWFDVGASVYVGEEGRTALRLASQYELLLSQSLILRPQLEVNAYGEADPENALGSGLADVEFGLRLRYEIRREFAPFVGVSWTRLCNGTADFARAAGEDDSEVQWLVGLRVWF
jgi:copper resistance protein B